MQKFYTLAAIFTVFGGIRAQFPPQIPDPDDCGEKEKFSECFARMEPALRSYGPGAGGFGAGPSEGPSDSMSMPQTKQHFDIACKGADLFEKCVEEKNLRQICANDPIFIQIDGTIGHICREPQKTGKRGKKSNLKLRCKIGI
jgi:hypothetical protein